MASDKLERDKPYRLGDPLTREECRRCGVDPWKPQEQLAIMAVWDGQPRRAPKAGEWYLSGAEVTAYRAPNDLGDAFHIARLVWVKRQERIIIIPIEERRPCS